MIRTMQSLSHKNRMTNGFNRLPLIVSSGLMFLVVTILAADQASTPNHAALQHCPAIQEEITDLELLAEGLKKSHAVGFLEKLRLRSSIDDLLDRFQTFHDGDRRFSLDELQQQYDVLLMRIASHLQHRDVLLHQQLCNAWEAIWQDLSDPSKFGEKFS